MVDKNGSLQEPMLQSKKFIAFLISDLTWKALAGMILFYGKGSLENDTFIVLMTLIITSGAVEIGYILGQASLDRYLHLAEVGLLKKDPDPQPPPKPTEGEQP